MCMCSGSYDKCVQQLRDKNKDNIPLVMQTIFSHIAVQQKNTLVILLIVSSARHDHNLELWENIPADW